MPRNEASKLETFLGCPIVDNTGLSAVAMFFCQPIRTDPTELIFTN